MKNSILLSVLLFLTSYAFSQAPPEGISYQAVALDAAGKEIVGVDARGEAIPDQAISLRFSILSDSAKGPIQYTEVHKTNTDAFGLFSVIIGRGTQEGGAVTGFQNINWGAAAHFLKVELDPKGGSEYSTMGIQQMMSVPYALYAKTSGSGGGQGPAGKSAYELWLDQGNTGTEADFLASLSGATGPQGPAGATGPAGPSGPAGAIGPQGPAGADGAPGAAGPQGPAGPQGTGLTVIGSVADSTGLPFPYTGSAGDGYITQNTGMLWIWDGSQWNNVGVIAGPAGQSAYELWLAQGNTGTVNDFLNSLTGPAGVQGPAGVNGNDGAAGPQGPQGAAGPQGPQGAQGAAGAPGTNGVSITWLGALAVAPGSPGLNQAYYNTAQGISFIWDGNSWEILAQDGSGGSGGSLQDAYNSGGPGAGRTINANAGSVLINLQAPSTIGLEVNSSTSNSSGIFSNHAGNGVAIRAENTAASNTFAGIQAITNSSDANNSAIIGANDGAGYAVSGQIPATATGFAAVFGSNLRTNGGSGVDGQGFQGVSGQTFTTGGTGIFGLHNNPGVGANPNANVVNAGVSGLGFYGNLGQTEYRNGTGVFGLNADAIGSLNDDASGVIGNGGFVGCLGTSGDPNGYGIGSLTNILAIGNIEALGVKTFTIDHPSDPANKTLRHAAIESNEVLNVYRGNILCNQQGEAMVELPAYFAGVNTDFSYILTPVGAAAPGLHVAQEINGNRFLIAGAQPGQKISWQVTAARNDLYMQNNPFSAEVNKPARKAGKFLYPQGYGRGQDASWFSSPLLTAPILPANTPKQQGALKVQTR